MPTAIFDDIYGGPTPVVLRRVGRTDKWIWESAPEARYRYAAPCGYRPAPLARAVRNAQRDRRFTEVRVEE